MRNNSLRSIVCRFFAVALVSLGFMPWSHAGMIGTQSLIEQQSASDSAARINVLLERQDIAQQLVAFGVDPDDVKSRIAGMTDAEILSLEHRLDSQVAGGDAIAVIGTVFLVLLVLELVGVTDVFKSI